LSWRPLQTFARDLVDCFEERQLLHHVFELAHVAGPAVGCEQGAGVVAERYFGGGVAFGEVGGEFPREQCDVRTAVAQRRHVDLHGREPVVEVLAEASFGHGFGHVDVGCGHDADVGALYGA